MNNSKLVVYIATSADGYIAKPIDDLSFLDCVQKEGEDYGYEKFLSTVDSVIVGRKTYDWVVAQIGSYPHITKNIYVVTKQKRTDEGNLHFYNGNLEVLVTQLKQNNAGNIFCDGGAEIVNGLLKLGLVDELILSIVPIFVGNGLRLFLDDRPEQKLELLSVQKFETGLVQVHYRTVR